MSTPDASRNLEDPQTYLIIGALITVHRNLGPGFLEAVYQKALEIEFRERGVRYEREPRIVIYYRGVPLGIGFRADFVCFGDILVELMGIPKLTGAEQAQVMNYLVASHLSRAILANFGGPSLQMKRLVGPSNRQRSSAVAHVLLGKPSVASGPLRDDISRFGGGFPPMRGPQPVTRRPDGEGRGNRDGGGRSGGPAGP